MVVVVMEVVAGITEEVEDKDADADVEPDVLATLRINPKMSGSHSSHPRGQQLATSDAKTMRSSRDRWCHFHALFRH